MNIENTANRHPIQHLVGMLDGNQTNYIEGMEAAGAQQVLTSDQIPTDAPWDDLTALGFVKGEPVAGDDLFTHVTLPAGWTRAGTGHSMHTHILDERGVRRVGIFYKAAFYDRRADAHMINVPTQLAREIVDGDGPITLPEAWPSLTADEREGVIEKLHGHIATLRELSLQAHDMESYYKARMNRAEAALALAEEG